MILSKPSYDIISIYGLLGQPMNLIELAGRTCYKSEEKITPESASKFVQKINKLGHHSVLEHSAMTVRFIIDRGVSHELVRHRLCAFSQESTRYCNYKDGVEFIIPPWINLSENSNEYDEGTAIRLNPGDSWDDSTFIWTWHMYRSEQAYLELLKLGWSPQQARSVLPNSLKTEIVVTANFREWQHIFSLRTSKAAHPQMREIMLPLLKECAERFPEIFYN